jgi:hypothetical protein
VFCKAYTNDLREDLPSRYLSGSTTRLPHYLTSSRILLFWIYDFTLKNYTTKVVFIVTTAWVPSLHTSVTRCFWR